MERSPNNPPFVVWATCLLWLASHFAIIWSQILFFFFRAILIMTGADLVNRLVLLSGLIMLPTHVYMLFYIANSKRIHYYTKILCCPLWMCILWIIFINFAGAIVCLLRLCWGKDMIKRCLNFSMRFYRTTPKYKHFMDTIQWSLGCCGMNSYKDWFNYDWYDQIRDYEWDPLTDKRNNLDKREVMRGQSVPLSCCTSGSCISHYLMDFGTDSIHTRGCSGAMYRLIMISMAGHLFFFLLVACFELILLRAISRNESYNNSYYVEVLKETVANFTSCSESDETDTE